MQHEGEVQPCSDSFHLAVTPENTPERIERLRDIALPVGKYCEALRIREHLGLAKLDGKHVAPEEIHRLYTEMEEARDALLSKPEPTK
jgi:hypothetical protein